MTRRAGVQTTPMERVRWSREVARMRAEGLEWKEIAKATGFSQRKCERLASQLREMGDPATTPAWDLVLRHHDTVAIVLEKAWETYAAAPEGSAVQVGALKAVLQASRDLIELAAQVGLVPRQLGALSAAHALDQKLRDFAEILRSEGVGDHIVRRVLEVAERDVFVRAPTVEGRELPAA